MVFSRELKGVFDHVPGSESFSVCELCDFGGPFLVQSGGLWALVLSRYILNQRERESFDQSRLPVEAAASWLLGRTVAKDAVRSRLSRDVCMADVALSTDRFGKPIVTLVDDPSPSVSLSHSGFEAVAIAADPGRFRGVGIDLEPIRTLASSLVEDAFVSEERRRIEAAALGDAGYLAAWCAKEAVGKALGLGLPGGPRDVELVDIDPRSGRVRAHVRGELASRSGGAHQNAKEVYYQIMKGRVIAICIVE